MVRLVFSLLGLHSARRAGGPGAAAFRPGDPNGRQEPAIPYVPNEYSDCGAWPIQREPSPRRHPDDPDPDWRDEDWRDDDWRESGWRDEDWRDEDWRREPGATRVLWRGEPGATRVLQNGPKAGSTVTRPRVSREFVKGAVGGGRRRRRIPLRAKWVAAIIVIGLIFRRAIAFVALTALSAALHLVGINVHLPHIKFAWPWQSISAGTVTDTPVGPWVLQKIEGISRPALGTETFSFAFTHKVNKSVGIWPCWYSSTFETVGRASATVDLNPGPAWWKPATGHYQLKVLSRPVPDSPGRVSVAIVLPRPQLPQSVHDITIDDTLSHPIDTQHSWTYPGLGCGALIKPQFSTSVLYAQAQRTAFFQATHDPKVTAPLIKAAESAAGTIIRDNFVQPTVNALGYTLTGFTIRWAGGS